MYSKVLAARVHALDTGEGIFRCSKVCRCAVGAFNQSKNPQGRPTQSSNHVIYVKLFPTLRRPFHGDMHILLVEKQRQI
jgi:hypothetical protein